MASPHRVVITGMGVVSPCGIGTNAFWDCLLAGHSGIGPITRFAAGTFPSAIAGQVNDFDPYQHLPRGTANRTDRFVQFALVAAQEAILQAGLPQSTERLLSRCGVLVGSGIGGFETVEQQKERYEAGGPRRITPYLMPRILPNMAAAEIAIRYGYSGPNFAIVSACATGGNCLGESMRLIQQGRVDAMVCGASEAPLTPVFFGGFSRMGALSTRNDVPEQASRPFDAERDGFVVAEGAGVLVLESLAAAKRRDAEPLAEIIGYSANCDAYHITAMRPSGEQMAAVMREAIEDAGLRADEIEHINAHGTSTRQNDAAETAAIKTVFGRHAYAISISSTKSCTGHLLGASGAVEAIASALALRDGVIAPTINQEVSDPDCDLDYTPNTRRERELRYAMSSSFGFGGHNACLVFKRFGG
jgi:3-oxoacyl-[acyl-carrier-protein] synthase II